MENINLLSNSEIRIKMKELENKYETLKREIASKIDEMSALDKKYNALNEVINKRGKYIL